MITTKPEPEVLYRGFHVVKIERDTAKRITKCRICSKKIPKGSLRLRITYKMNNPRLYAGRQVWYTKLFMHPKCAGEQLLGEVTDTEISCTFCNSMGRPQQFQCYGSKFYEFACPDCKKFLDRCKSCGGSYCKRDLSPVTTTWAMQAFNKIDAGDLVCQRCEMSYDYKTIRSERISQKADTLFQIRWNELIGKVRSRGIWGDLE